MRINVLILMIIFIFVSLIIIPIGVVTTFGDIEIESIIFHLFMPQKNSANDWIYSILPFLFLDIFISIILYLLRHNKKVIFIYITFFIFYIPYLDKHFSVMNYFKSLYNESSFIEKNYIFPLERLPKKIYGKKRNLIIIQVESLETSFQDKKNGGLCDENYISELTQLARENISFSSSSDKIIGAIVLPETGWTMGGVVAETAGIPLKSYKLHTAQEQIGNTYGKYVSFLDGVISLGDILKLYEYKNYFILGTSKDFAGQDIYFKNHGQYTIFDIKDITKELHVKKVETKWWGLFDKDLFAFSKQKILNIAKQKEPFSIFIQTIDTHRDGVLSPDCQPKYDKNIKNVYACASSHINDFISWCKKQAFFKNTTIVIVGDHCNMSQSLFKKGINKKTGYYEGTERRIYNVFINSMIKPEKGKKRYFSTMDIFPSIIASLGITIEGNRLGLGTNLFSKRDTLLEEKGYDTLYSELRKKSHFYNKKLLYHKK